jgi:hypothetical protein
MKTKQNEILEKPTMATFTKSTEKMERKPDGNANANANENADGNSNAISIPTGIKSCKVEPAPLAPFTDETASSEDIYLDASDEKAPSDF